MCNETGLINDLRVKDLLGKSDHNMIEFHIQFEDEKLGSETSALILNKGNYKDMKMELATVDWQCNPEPEVTWYKGGKQLTKVLRLPKYEVLKDDKVHTLKLYRCTEDDAAIYQVSARNSKGIAICSSVLQVGFVTEAQVRQKIMQKLRERNEDKKALESRPSEMDSPISWGCYSKSSKDRLSNTAAEIHSTENPVQSSIEGKVAGDQSSESIEETPSGIPGFTPAEQMDKLAGMSSSAVASLPNTVKRDEVKDLRQSVGGCHSLFPVGPQSRSLNGAASPKGDSRSSVKLSQGSGGDFSGENLLKGDMQRCKWNWPAISAAHTAHLTAEDEDYLDWLVCSDVLTEQDNALWQHQLDCPSHVFLPEGDGPETDEVKVTWRRQSAFRGHPGLPAEAAAVDIIDIHCSRPAGTGERMCSTRSFSLIGSVSASEKSRALGKGGDEICPISPEVGSELPPLTPRASCLKTCSAPSNGNQAMIICQKRESSAISESVIHLDMLEGDRATEGEREKVLQKESFQELPEKNGNRAEEAMGGLTPPAGELDPGDVLPTPRTANTTETLGDTATDSRLTHESRHPAKPPPSLGKNSTPPRNEGVEIGAGEETVEMSPEEKNDSSSDRAEMKPLLLKDIQPNFTKSTVSLTNYEDDHSSCLEKKTDLLPLDTYITLSSQQDNHDHEANCGRLNTDCKIPSNALIVENVASQSSDFKDKYHVQDKELSCEKIPSFITKDDELICIFKEYQESNSDYKAKTEHTRHLTQPSIRDCCIQSKNSDLCENSFIYDKELKTSEQPSELYIQSEYLEHPSSIVCKGSESDLFKKEDTCGSIDPYLDTQPCLTVPVKIQDISGSLDTSSNMFLIGGKHLDKESTSTSNINTNDDPRPTDNEGTLQISECYRNKSSQMDACGHEFVDADLMEVVCPIAVLESYNMYKQLTNEIEQLVLENGTSQKGGAKSHRLPLNRAEEHNQMWCHLGASENKVHKENRSIYQSVQCTETAEIEACRTCLYSYNKEMSNIPETSRSTACQLDDQLPIEQPVLFQCNLEIQSNQLIPFNSKTDGSSWPSKGMECKTDSTGSEPLVATHQETSVFTLVDHEKMQNDEPFLLKSLCWNSTGNKTKNINHEEISNVTYVENEAPCKTEDGINNDHLGDVISDKNDEQVCNQFYNSTEIVMSPVSCPPNENEHFNVQSRIGPSSNSENMLNLEDYLQAPQYNDEPEIVKSDDLQSSISCFTDVEQNISPLKGRNQRKMMNIEVNNVVNIMESVAHPAPKEQNSSAVWPPIIDQSIRLQEICRPVQNSMEHIADVDMKDEYGRVQDLEDVQTIGIDSLESSLIDGPNLNITQSIQSTLQDESHFECLSILVADETKATNKTCDIDIKTIANFKYSEDSTHFDETMVFQDETSHGEKNSENHNITSAECDNEIDQGHINAKMKSTENLESATSSVSSMVNVPSDTEQVKDLSVRTATIGLNKNTQKVEYLHDCKANQSEISKCVVTNMDKIVAIQSKGQLMNKEKESAVVTEENNKSTLHNDCFPAVNSIGTSIIIQPVVDQLMNVDSNVLEGCRECNKRPIGSNLNKSNYTAVVRDHPQKCIKMDTDAECKGKISQTSFSPSKNNQKFLTYSKIKNLPMNYKNDKNQTEPPNTHTTLKVSLHEGQKMTIAPEPPISLQTKSFTEKSIPSIPSHNKQQTTAVRIKQTLSAGLAKELMSSARDKICFLESSNETAMATTETVGLAPSLNDQQKKEPIKHRNLSADNVGKSTLEKSKQALSSAGKKNLNKRIYAKTKEEPTNKKEHKELKKIKHPQKNEHKAPKLTQKIHAEVLPNISGNVKLWCRFCDIHADSTIIWTKDGVILTKVERSAGDDSPVSLAIVQTTKKDRGLYQCCLKNVYGSVSCEFDFTTEVLNELLSYRVVEGQSLIKSVNPNDLHAFPGSVAGEEIELLQLIVEKELTNECNFDVKMCGSIVTEELHFGEGLHRKAFRTKVIYGFVPLFDPGHNCVLKIHNAILHGTKTSSELIQQNYILAVQAGGTYPIPHVTQSSFFSRVIPIYLIHRPANNIPYATVEEELIGEFVKYSVKDGRELNVSRRESEVGHKCCTFQHWVYQWTEGNLLVTDMQGVGMKLTDVGIATSRKGYKGFKGNCSISFIDQFKALHQCNMYCKMMGLKSLKVSQHKPKRNPPMKTQASQPIPRSTKKLPLSPRSTRRSFTSQAKSISGDKTLQKHV
ncbi:alpha-protein kinase 2 [Heterodontus francisci]|uniref:alpha-protein kinase 2 n=1 Tax=Heterodontus francisci TaxID=7792 RepID=UPI00355C4FD8